MWFVWFYIISTIICYVCILIIALSIKQKLKKINIPFNGKKSSFVEILSAFLPFLIPFINIILVLIAIFAQEEVLKKVTQKIENENK